MSFITGTQAEVLAASTQPGTNLATFTTEDSLQKTLAPIIIPAGFFFNAQSAGKTLKVKASGLLGSTATPTFTWSARLLTSTSWTAGGILLGSSPALTTGSGVTLAPWFLELDIVMRNPNPGATSVICAQGEVRSAAGLASPFGGSIPPANTSPQISTFDNSLTYYLFLSAACSASNAANLINLQMIKCYGEN